MINNQYFLYFAFIVLIIILFICLLKHYVSDTFEDTTTTPTTTQLNNILTINNKLGITLTDLQEQHFKNGIKPSLKISTRINNLQDRLDIINLQLTQLMPQEKNLIFL